jgi:hypothetical protein
MSSSLHSAPRVEPDVKVKAADALEVAEKLGESKLQKKYKVWEVPE